MLPQIILNSMLSASLLSLIAIGFNLIFNATKVFHLAHGAMLVCGCYAFYFFQSVVFAGANTWVSIPSSFVISLLVVSGLIYLVEFLVYRPLYLRSSSQAISLVSSLAVYTFLVNAITFQFGNEAKPLSQSSEIVIRNDYIKLTTTEGWILALSGLLIIGILIFTKTSLYTKIRAIADNYQVAQKFGINVNRVRLLSLVTGSALACFAGILRGYEVGINPDMGLTLTLAAAVAVIVGGANSIPGTLLACLIIGLIENFSALIISDRWKETLTYVLLLVVLVFYKDGLFSVRQRIEER